MTTLAMSKIVVVDLAACETFYRSVCGFDQVERITGEGFAEAIMRPSGNPAGAALVLFADGSAPPPGEAVLVFETEDVATFAARVTAAGGTITHPPQHIPALGLTFALFRDGEGHTLEAIAYTRN